jgi:hypothetical protein
MRVAGAAFLVLLSTACVRGERATPTVAAAPAIVEAPPEPEAIVEAIAPAEPAKAITYGAWDGFGPRGCSFMAPTKDFVRPDGSVDVVFHFHAGQMSDRELRASGLNAVFVSCGWGVGTAPYANAFVDPSRFEGMTKTVLRRVGARGVHKIALVSWSAGFAAISKILRVPKYYAMVDAVVLLDSLHSAYTSSGEVDPKMLAPFSRFAIDAAHGERAMVITHSSIVPPGYASSTEATLAVLSAIDVPTADRGEKDVGGETMRLSYRADAGNLHVRGYRGQGPRDHFDHLHLVGEVLRNWVVPRWNTDRSGVYTPASE